MNTAVISTTGYRAPRSTSIFSRLLNYVEIFGAANRCSIAVSERRRPKASDLAILGLAPDTFDRR